MELTDRGPEGLPFALAWVVVVTFMSVTFMNNVPLINEV